MSRVNHPSPAKIIGQVMCSDSMKPDHPFLEPADVGVHVLRVVNLADHFDSCGHIDLAVDDTDFARRSTQRPAAVCAKHGITRQQRLECRADVRFIRLFQNKIGCAAGTITANQHRNLLLGHAEGDFYEIENKLFRFSRKVRWFEIMSGRAVSHAFLPGMNSADSV